MIVFSSSRDAVLRRHEAIRAAAGDADPRVTTSTTAALIAARQAPPQTLIFVDPGETACLAVDRSGERLIGRITSASDLESLRVVAWSAQRSPDVVEGARRAGAHAFIAGWDDELEPTQLRQLLAGAATWPADMPEDDWDDWFGQAYQVSWRSWMEAALVRLARGTDRLSAADELVAIGAASGPSQGAGRLRQVAKLIAGEHAGTALVVAQRAVELLAELAARRVLAERPGICCSLQHSASLLRGSPSIAAAAMLTTAEIEDVLAIDDLIQTQRSVKRASAGAPRGDQVRAERLWAAGRRALQLPFDQQGIDAAIQGVLGRIDRASVALHDARLDEYLHPAPRAAAALLALDQAAPAHDIAGVAYGKTPTWRGYTPEQLAMSSGEPRADLQEFTMQVDRWLAQSGVVRRPAGHLTAERLATGRR